MPLLTTIVWEREGPGPYENRTYSNLSTLTSLTSLLEDLAMFGDVSLMAVAQMCQNRPLGTWNRRKLAICPSCFILSHTRMFFFSAAGVKGGGYHLLCLAT